MNLKIINLHYKVNATIPYQEKNSTIKLFNQTIARNKMLTTYRLSCCWIKTIDRIEMPTTSRL